MPSDDVSVRFTVAEMLTRTEAKNDERWSRVERKLDEIGNRLGSKADRAHLDQLVQRITDLELNGTRTAREASAEVRDLDTRLRVAETSDAAAKAVARSRRSDMANVIALITAVAALILALRH